MIMSPSVLAQIFLSILVPKKEQLIKRNDFIFQSTLTFVFFFVLFVSFRGYVRGCFPSSYFQYLSNTVQLSSITQATCKQCGWCWHVLYYFAFGFSSSLWGMTLVCHRGGLIDGPSPKIVVSYFIIWCRILSISLYWCTMKICENQ